MSELCTPGRPTDPAPQTAAVSPRAAPQAGFRLSPGRAPLLCFALSALAVFLPCCKPEEKVVSVKGGWNDLARMLGGQGGEPPAEELPDTSISEPDRWEQLLAKSGYKDPGEPIEGRPYRRQMPDGSYYLISRAPRHVMIHLFETLRDREYDLLMDQVLSQRTKQAYQAAGRDPKDALAFLVRNQREIDALLAAMPVGEQTPGVIVSPLGRNEFRLELSGMEVLDLRFHQFDVILEQGRFRLLMIN